MDPKNEKISKDAEPLYDELKNLYDWSDSDPKSKPRIKGDRRIGGDDKVDSSNAIDELSHDQIESPEDQGPSESSGERREYLRSFSIIIDHKLSVVQIPARICCLSCSRTMSRGVQKLLKSPARP
ncbi:uncharacterized protein LOC143374909 [Andrena cerasifolii]|uniref:uncharacterized protein LOC143374909 n=1 Tax=Andrena cerasifolii TaxID=2819439 RepID=UPI0040378027